MSRKANDLIGHKFGRLTVIERAENKGKRACWRCRCECGNEVIVKGHDLKSHGVASCGCLRTTHGLTKSKIYDTWHHAKQRCYNVNNKNFSRYGGRGIGIYEPWQNDFAAFYNYVSQLEHFNEENYSLDRIDNSKGYEPNNLRFADKKTQQRNKQSNIIIEYNGERMTLPEAAEKFGIRYGTLQQRYQRGDRGGAFVPPNKKSPAGLK